MYLRLINLLLFEVESLRRQQKKAKKRMSKLTDAVAAIKAAVVDLQTREANEQSDLQAQLDAANAEADAAADELTSLTADITGVDAATTPPVDPNG